MNISPISHGLALKCPLCGTSLLNVSRDKQEPVSEHEAWLNDGDAVALYDALTPEQRAKPNDSCLMVGRCLACGQSYYALVTTFLESGNQNHMYDFLAGDLDVSDPSSSNYICQIDDRDRWVLSIGKTKIGLSYEHLMGPFFLHSLEDVMGPHGVTACGEMGRSTTWQKARTYLLARWNTMLEANKLANVG